MRLPLHLLVGASLVACGGDDSSSTPNVDGGQPDGSSSACPRTPAAADRDRFVVVSHPFGMHTEGQPVPGSRRFEVVQLSASGALAQFSPPRYFEMERASYGEIVFTPDGKVGLVATEMGTIDVFTLDDAGMPTVVHDGFSGDFYAKQVVMAPSGDRAYVLDSNTVGNGGGINALSIGCDGTLTDLGSIADVDFGRGLVIGPDGRALIAARSVGSTAAGQDVHLLELGDTVTHVAGVDAFGDDNAVPSNGAIDESGTTYIVGDTTPVGTNRLAVVEIGADSLTTSAVIPIEDPQSIRFSPFDENLAIVTSAFGDAIFALDKGGANGAWRVRGELTYTGGNPALPGDTAMLTRGSLRGHVFVSENVSIRHLQFGTAAGSVTDLGKLSFGSGTENVLGVIGVQP